MEINEFIMNFADQFDDTDASEIKAETIFRDLNEWSSMTGLAVLNMCDNDYDVTLTLDDLNHAVTVQELFNIVTSKK